MSEPCVNTSRQIDLLCVDLGLMRISDDQAAYLGNLLAQAARYIETKGITLDPASDEDNGLIARVAAWMYRSRATTADTPLPSGLRSYLHDKLLQQKMREVTP